MALPLAIGYGVLTLAANAYAAYKKGEISKEEYNNAVRAANELENKLKTMRPDESWENIDPQLLQKAAEYVPDIAAFVEENAPQIITEAGSSAEKRIQRQALQKYAAQAETGRDVIAEAQREQALFEADARAKQRQQALMERMRQQGLLGSGAALAAQLQSEQATAQEARMESLRGTQEAELRRRQALGEAAQLAGQLRSQALNVESANVQTMNAYNQRLANARNLYNQYASGARNQAQLENQRREIAREQANLELANRYALMNRKERIAAKERARQFDVDLAKDMYKARQSAEAGRFGAERQKIADYTTAATSAIGGGMSAYGIPSGGSPSALTDDTTSDYTGPLSRNAAPYQSEDIDVMGQTMSGIPQIQDTTPAYSGPLRPTGSLTRQAYISPTQPLDIEMSSRFGQQPQRFSPAMYGAPVDEFGRELPMTTYRTRKYRG